MLFSEIHPFVRYVHFLPISPTDSYGATMPLDNRLFYIYSGGAPISVEDKIYDLAEGDAILIPSGFKYRLISPEKQVTYIGVNFDYTQSNSEKSKPINPIDARSFLPDMLLESVSFSDFPDLRREVFIKNARCITEKLLNLEEEYSARRLYSELITSSIFTVILTELARAVRQKDISDGAFIKSVLSYVKSNLSKDLTNAHVAEAFNMHPNYLSRLVKSYTGMPLHRYLLHARISHAIDMLGKGERSIGEIAEACGFVDIYHFSKAFKRLVGTSPSKYR